MKKLFISLLAAFAAAVTAHAESDGTFSFPRSGSFDVDRPSGEAAALATHMGHTVDYSTGRAQFSAELCRLEADGISLPITISHTTGGIKTDAEDGLGGVGWTMSAGGFISRAICGKPDDKDGYRMPWDKCKNSADSLQKVLEGHYDTGADRYTFEAGGVSGEFLILKGEGIKVIP